MYTISEPFINTKEAIEGNVPFFLVKDLNESVVFSAVTRQECEDWVNER